MRRVLVPALAAALGLAAIGLARGAVIVGTSGPDRLIGTSRGDELYGLGGNDRLVGRGATDLIDGGPGRDRLLGGPGADRLAANDRQVDMIACGSGRDLVVADRTDRVSGDCETVSRQLSRDTGTDFEAQHETQVEPDSFAYGRTIVTVFQSGRFTNGGAERIGFSTSRNGGQTWRSGRLPGSFERVSDPVVAFDAQHRWWIATSLASEAAVAVNRSRNGLAWRAPLLVSSNGQEYDKEWIACDNWPASPFYGRCYLSYTDVDTNTIATRYSSDGGATWSGAVQPPGNAGQAGASGNYAPGVQPVVLPSGVVVIVYYDGRRMAAVRSTDGGASYTPAVDVAPISFDDPGTVRAAPLPTAAVDDAGTIYMSWPDCAARAGCRGNDVVLTRSRDGITWSPPARASLGSGNHLLPALAATGTGRLALTYYVLAGGRLGVRATTSADGGATWSSPQRLDTESMQLPWVAESRAAMVGDYVASVFAGTRSLSVFSFAARPNRGLRQAIFASAHG